MPSDLICSVCKIGGVSPHPNADRLEIANVKGWQCCVQKGAFKEGDKVVYFPIDTILPFEVEEIIFPPGSKIKLKDHRVRTIKLRGVISQGLVVPAVAVGCGIYPNGYDVVTTLNLTKHTPPVKGQPSGLRGNQTKKRDCNPHFTKYTSLNHLKNCVNGLNKVECAVVTEKIHGSNWRAGYVKRECRSWLDRLKKLFDIAWQPLEFVYGSHNVQLQYKKASHQGYYPENFYYEMVAKYDVMGVLQDHYPDKSIVLYGEVYGSGIQKGYCYGCAEGERKLVLFDCKIDGEYIGWDELEMVSLKIGIPLPPVLYKGQVCSEDVVVYVGGDSVLCEDQKVREGIVVRTIKNSSNCYGRKLFKILNPEYLLNKNTEWS